MERTCSKCNRPFPLTAEFFPSRKYRGHSIFQSFCRKCENARQKEWRNTHPGYNRGKHRVWVEANREYVNEKLRAWAKANSQNKRRHQNKWIIKNHDYYLRLRRVYTAVKKAIERGDLMRPLECSRCNIPCVPHAHHHLGYAKEHWLDVIFLCRKCHHAEHQKTDAPSSAA